MDNMLSILIGTMNRLPTLRITLEALLDKVTFPHEIIVVDAGSTDGTLEYLHHLKNIQIVSDGQPIGQAKSLNRIIKNLNSQFVCWLSDDNVVADGMLDKSVQILLNRRQIGMVGQKVKDITGKLSDLPYIGGHWSGILNCNQGMLPTRLMQALGGFDEEFRDYGIDIDLTTRVLLAGYEVVLTKDVAIRHYRDHQTSAWIDSEGRKERLQIAQELYNNKYAAIRNIKYGNKFFKGKNSFLMRAIVFLYDFAGQKGVSLEKKTGLSERDWRNAVCAQFISSWDLILNWQKPYYLVQKIPASAINQLTENLKNL